MNVKVVVKVFEAVLAWIAWVKSWAPKAANELLKWSRPGVTPRPSHLPAVTQPLSVGFLISKHCPCHPLS